MELKKTCFSVFPVCSVPMASCASSDRHWMKARLSNCNTARKPCTRFRNLLSSEQRVEVSDVLIASSIYKMTESFFVDRNCVIQGQK